MRSAGSPFRVLVSLAFTAGLVGGALASCSSGSSRGVIEPEAGAPANPAPAAAPGAVLPIVASGAARLVGPVEPATPMRFTVVLLPHRDDLSAFARAVTDPASAQFRKFLGFDEAKRRFSPTDAEVEQVAAWARQQSLTEVQRYRTNMAIRFEAPVGVVNRALGVVLNEYESGGHHFFANDRTATIPPPIAPLVADVLGLESARRSVHVGSSATLQDIPAPTFRAGPLRIEDEVPSPYRRGARRPEITGPLQSGFIEPQDLWSSQAYDFGPLKRLAGCCDPIGAAAGNAPGSLGFPAATTIAVDEQNNSYGTDLGVFFATYGLNASVWRIDLDGALFQSGGSVTGDSEATLDAEWAAAVAAPTDGGSTALRIISYADGTTIDTLYDMWQQMDSDDYARILSASVGVRESAAGGLLQASLGDFYDTSQDMVAKGWTLVGFSGDRGAYNDGPNAMYPASDPYFVGVGGTTLSLGAGGTFSSEIAWQGPANPNVNAGGGGGGCSGDFQPPPWQTGYVNGPSNYCLQGPLFRKSIPDLALNAGSLQIVHDSCTSDTQCPGNPYAASAFSGTGGTSIATPEIAGLFALENSYLLQIAMKTGKCQPGDESCSNLLGTPGPALWAATSAPHNPYYDITVGNNCPNAACTFNTGSSQPNNGYAAGPGYDKVTGWGSVNALQLAWALNWFTYGKATRAPWIVLATSNIPPPGYPYTSTGFDYHIQINQGSGAPTAGIAGYTYAFDTIQPDSASRAAPGAGDSFYDGPQNFYRGPFSIPAPQGCHSLWVRAWDDAGNTSVVDGGVYCVGTCSGIGSGGLCQATQGEECCETGTSCASDPNNQGIVACHPSSEVCGGTYCPAGNTCLSGAGCCANDMICNGECLRCSEPVQCGSLGDSCGHYIECGRPCPEGYLCENNACVVNHRCMVGYHFCNGACIPGTGVCP